MCNLLLRRCQSAKFSTNSHETDYSVRIRNLHKKSIWDIKKIKFLTFERVIYVFYMRERKHNECKLALSIVRTMELIIRFFSPMLRMEESCQATFEYLVLALSIF